MGLTNENAVVPDDPVLPEAAAGFVNEKEAGPVVTDATGVLLIVGLPNRTVLCGVVVAVLGVPNAEDAVVFGSVNEKDAAGVDDCVVENPNDEDGGVKPNPEAAPNELVAGVG